jgi:hypothetical protein
MGLSVRGRFLSIFGLEAHDYWISVAKDNNPLYPPLLRGNPSNSRYSRHLSIGIGRKNLPLTGMGVWGMRTLVST